MLPGRISKNNFALAGSGFSLWSSLSAAWFTSLVVSYFAVHEVCRVHSSMAPRIVSFVALVVAVAAGFTGRGIWVGAAQSERARFMAQIGVLGGALAFGFIGVFIGPTLLAVGYRLVQEWSQASPGSPAIHLGEDRPKQTTTHETVT